MFHGMEYVYEVYKERSFSKAARNLYISQPALSSSVKRVEERVGMPLFDRSTTPVKLTECGEQYIQAAEQIFSAQRSFSDYLADTRKLEAGQLTIGGIGMFASYILPPLISEYKSKYPKISVSMMEESQPQLEKLLIKGTLDLVVNYQEFAQDVFETCPYREEHLLLAVPQQFPVNSSLLAWRLSLDNVLSGDYLAERYPAVPLEAFENEPFIFLRPNSDINQRAIQMCQSCGFTPRVILTLEQQLTAYNMVSTGMGIAFVSDTLAKNILPHPNIAYYKLNRELSRRIIYFYYKKNRYISRAMEEFLEIARQKEE
ncbi:MULTISPECIES: LysR family transcriptional regulator [unclassified Oscillibacter]|uniref:LysR family transcriptional regulator n=1 Tax=unclassified Oscillibacter TaxID=2629304 RepID=UPI0025F3B0DF|nr:MULTISPECIES: LysR family transcriptional regulator [unclassified Oscillibacter]